MRDGSFLEVLKNRNFIFLWLAQTLAQFADRIFLFFMVVLVTKDQFSNSAVGMLTLIHTLPAIIFGSIAGVFVDRLQKKNIMAICNIFRAMSVFMLPFSEKFAYLYLITFIVSSFTQFFAPAESAMIPILIDKKNLLPANSLFMGTMFSSVVFGFALGAPIINSFSEATNILAIGSMYFLSAFFIFMVGIKEKVAHNHHESSFFKEYKDGYLYVMGHKTILFCVIRQIIVFSAFAALSVLVIGFVNDVLYLNTAYFGYLLAIAGIGMGLGSLFSGKFGNRIGKDKLIFIGFIVSSISLVILSLTNYIAWGIGMERVTQQKELFNSLSVLHSNRKSIIQDLEVFLKVDSSGEHQLKSQNKLESLSNIQLEKLSSLLSIEKTLLLKLYKDEKIKKITISNFLLKLSKKDYVFIDHNNKLIDVSNKNTYIDENAKSIKFFLKVQNSYLVKELFYAPSIHDKVLKNILILTNNDIKNVEKLSSLLILDDNGFSTLNLHSSLSSLNSNSIKNLADILNIDPDELTFSDTDIKKELVINLLEYVINNDASKDTVERATALKELLPIAKTEIVKILLKKQASGFEISFAFIVIVLVGFGSALSAIPLQAILQEIVEENMRGKVFGVQNVLISISMSVPMAISGFLADALDGKFGGMKGVPVVMIITSIYIFTGSFVENTLKINKE